MQLPGPICAVTPTVRLVKCVNSPLGVPLSSGDQVRSPRPPQHDTDGERERVSGEPSPLVLQPLSSPAPLDLSFTSNFFLIYKT